MTVCLRRFQQLQLWARTLPPKIAVTEKDDYIPEEFQLLYEIQQFGHLLGGKPLITMIGVKSPEGAPPPGLSQEQGHALYEERLEEKRAFRQLSTNSKVIEVKDAGHAIHLEDPEAVVNAIREVMNAALHDALLKGVASENGQQSTLRLSRR